MMGEGRQNKRRVQSGPRPNRSRVDRVYTLLGKIIQDRKAARLTKCCLFLGVQKADDTVSRSGLWKKLRELGIRGSTWIVVVWKK